MKRYEFNKLIRHKLPERMSINGVKINGQQLDQNQYLAKLNEKLIEETKEVIEAKGDHLKIELADVLEVIHAIAYANNFTIEQIEEARIKKCETNGHFSPEHYINYIEVALDNKKVIDYMESDDKKYKAGR